MAKLYFRYGAMGSSKTAQAIMVGYNYAERGQRVLMLKPRLDTRDGARTVRSRCGLETDCAFVEELDAIDASAYACLIVDEAQFLTKAQVEQLVRVVDELNVPVIAEGGVWERGQLQKVFSYPVHAAVIGTAITRPRDITRRFVEAIS